MPASNELLDRFAENPEGLAPLDKFVVGISTLGAIQETDKVEANEKAINSSSWLTANALDALRQNPETTEAQKFWLARKTLSTVDFARLPTSAETSRLYAATIFTLAGGVETQIREKMTVLREGINRSFMELAEVIFCEGASNQFSPRDKVVYIDQTLGENFSSEQRRQNAVLRATLYATDPSVDDETFFDILSYFGEVGDIDAVGIIHLARLKTYSKPEVV